MGKRDRERCEWREEWKKYVDWYIARKKKEREEKSGEKTNNWVTFVGSIYSFSRKSFSNEMCLP